MEDYRTVLRLIDKDCFMATIDLKDAYHLIPVDRQYRKYLRFHFSNQLYEYTCIPFGLSVAPRLFTKILRPVAVVLRAKGHLSNFYLDDILLLHKSIKGCEGNVFDTINLLTSLGFLISYEKSNTIPTQMCEYLGFIFNSKKMKISLPVNKRNKISKLIHHALASSNISIQQVAVLIGNLVAASPALAYSQLYTRNLETEKTLALLKNHNDFSKLMSFSTASTQDLIWWKNNIPIVLCPIRDDSYDYVLYTDSSKTGWGCACKDKVTRGFWTSRDRLLHINVLEIKAIYNSLRSLFDLEFERKILLRVDNKTAIAYINRYGGCRSTYCHEWACEIWKWCEVRKNYIFATYIPSKENIVADKASREEIDDTDFYLDQVTYNRVVNVLGLPKIDMFATSLTKKCNRFISWLPDVGSENVDAFTIEWEDDFYAFPPFALVTRVLKKIRKDRVEGIIIVPNWPAQAWYPILRSLTVSKLVFLPLEFVLKFSHDELLHPLSSTLSLIAVRVSGRI